MDQFLTEPDSDTDDGVATVFPQAIDNTMYSDWRACPHRFFRRHCQGLTKGRTNVHLHFGACFASALEVTRMAYLGWFREREAFVPSPSVRVGDTSDPAVPGWSRSDPDDLRDAVKLGCEEFIRAWGTFEPPAFSTRSELVKTLHNGLLAVESYFREWPLDEDTCEIYIHHDGKPGVECSFSSIIPGTRHPETGEPVVYCGRFDAIVREGKVLYGLDDKTTSSLGDHWRNQWRLRSQFTGYVWGARQYGITLDGFKVRGTSVQKTQITHEQASVARPPWHVDRWLAQLRWDVNAMCEQYTMLRDTGEIEPHPFSRNLDHACSDFSGCEFLDLCASEHPDVWLDEYRVERWNPLTRPSA